MHNLAGNDTSTSMILESDGSVIAAGYNGSGTTATGTLIRFTPAGVLDTTFGTGGVFTGAAGSEILDVTGDSTGKIYAAGSAGNDALVQRFTSAGVLDTSFGNAGTISKVIGAGPDVYSRVLLDASGNIVLDGTTTIATAATEAQLVRLTPTAGALDNTFGTGGTAVLTNPATVTIHALRIQADGKILFGGGSGQNAILGRVTTAGALDTTFATAGVYSARIDGGSVFTDIQIDSLGRIVVCGSFGPINQDMSAARFAP